MQDFRKPRIIYTDPIMHMRYLRHIFLPTAAAIATALTLVSCNDEVFVDAPPTPDTVRLSPSGGHYAINLQTKETKYLEFYSPSGFDGVAWHLGPEGDTIATSNITGTPIPGGLALESTSMAMRIMASADGHITIDLDHCYSLSDSRFDLFVTYPYATVTIPVIIEAIEPFVASDITYRSNFLVNPDRRIAEKESIVVENMSADTLTADFQPYYRANAFVSFAGAPHLPVSSSAELEVPTPGHDGPGLYGFMAPFIPGERQAVAATGLPDINVRVKVPPMSSRRYTIFLEYETITARYVVTLSSPSVDREIKLDGIVKTEYPVDYIIGYNDLNPTSDQ